MNTFTTGQMVRLSGIALATVQDWALRQHIVPVGEPTPGKGNVRAYPPQAAFGVCVGALLQRAGVHGESVARAVRFCCRANLQQRLDAGQRHLCVTADRVTVLTTQGVKDLIKPDAELGAWALLDLAKLHSRFAEVALSAKSPADLAPLLARPEEAEEMPAHGECLAAVSGVAEQNRLICRAAVGR